MKDKNENIIYLIGLISLKFSKLKHLSLRYLSVLISGYETVDNYMIFQDYTFEKKLQTLKRLIQLKHRGRFEEIQTDLIERIGKLKTTRNLFIHGDWQIPDLANLDKIETISVKQNKVRFSRDRQDFTSKQWTPEKYKPFTKQDFIDFISEIDNLVSELNSVIDQNENIFNSVK